MADKLRIGVWSDPGAQGTAGAWGADEEAGVFVLADASRCGTRGADAARAAVDAVSARLGTRPPGEDAAATLKEAFGAAQRVVHRIAPSSAEGDGVMLLAALLDEGRLSIAHVGVVRAYLLRAAASGAPSVPSHSRYTPSIVLPDGSRLTCLTHDHGDVADRVERGEVTREAAREHPERGRPSRVVGADAAPVPDV